MTVKRGFASMSPEKLKEIASKGGKTAHQMGKAHLFTKEEASAAGKKGGANVFLKLGKDHMAKIGAKGGVVRGVARRGVRTELPLNGMSLGNSESVPMTGTTTTLEPVDLV